MFFSNNDTRVKCARAPAVYVLGQPLPEVLKTVDHAFHRCLRHVALGGSRQRAGLEINGRKMKSVTGGGHFGGGMFITNARRHGAFGHPLPPQRQVGRLAAHFREVGWHGKSARPSRLRLLQLVPQPSGAAPDGTAGPLPFLGAPVRDFQGNGVNAIYIDWDHDIVAVVRWIQTTRVWISFSAGCSRQ